MNFILKAMKSHMAGSYGSEKSLQNSEGTCHKSEDRYKGNRSITSEIGERIREEGKGSRCPGQGNGSKDPREGKDSRDLGQLLSFCLGHQVVPSAKQEHSKGQAVKGKLWALF